MSLPRKLARSLCTVAGSIHNNVARANVFRGSPMCSLQRGMSTTASSAYDFTVKSAKCGFTPQYKGLQALHDQYKDKGFIVHAFPCNQFGNQDPGSSGDIANQVCERFRITFPIYEKVNVKGFAAETEPLFIYLKNNRSVMMSKEIWWNFEKFLVDQSGKVVKRYSSTTTPASIAKDVQKLIGA